MIAGCSSRGRGAALPLATLSQFFVRPARAAGAQQPQQASLPQQQQLPLVAGAGALGAGGALVWAPAPLMGGFVPALAAAGAFAPALVPQPAFGPALLAPHAGLLPAYAGALAGAQAGVLHGVPVALPGAQQRELGTWSLHAGHAACSCHAQGASTVASAVALQDGRASWAPPRLTRRSCSAAGRTEVPGCGTRSSAGCGGARQAEDGAGRASSLCGAACTQM